MLDKENAYRSPAKQTFSKKFRSILFSNNLADSPAESGSAAREVLGDSRLQYSNSAREYKFVFSLLQSSDKKRQRCSRKANQSQLSTAPNSQQCTPATSTAHEDVSVSPFWAPAAPTLLQAYREAAFHSGDHTLFSPQEQPGLINLHDFFRDQRGERVFQKLLAKLINLQ